MNNILNGTEAFAALMAGKNILCRAVGDLIDFDDLDQFPATVFAKANYEFCIKIEIIEVAGITFTKPLALEDIQEGQDIYTINTHGPSIHVSEFGKMTTHALLESINSGFAQRDADNAKRQLQAMAKVVGCELMGECAVVRLGAEKPKRNVKKANTTASSKAMVEVELSPMEQLKQLIESAIDTDTLAQVSNKILASSRELSSDELAALQSLFEERGQQLTKDVDDQTSTSNDVKEKTSQAKVWKTSAHETHETLKETREMAEALMNPKPDIETNSAQLVEKFTALIAEADTLDAVMQIRYQLNANGHLERHQVIELNKLGEQRIEALNQAVLEQQVEPIHQYQEHLDILLNDIALATTPVEANAQIKYTKSWSEGERKPVIQAINKRLTELKSMSDPVVEETPSLMVQIQNAPDLTALDVLEIDVGGRHPDIQPKLMGYVKKRRFELENGAGPIGAPL